MFYNKLGLAAACAAAYATAASAASNSNGGLTLKSANVNQGSFTSGIGELGSEAGQAASTTSTNNFINFCDGKTINNGLQILTGSCVGVVMGDLPAKNKMVSAIITFPQQGKTIASNTDFNITLQTSGLTAGSFTDPDTTYYAAPQQLDNNGQVIGHCHVTVQDMNGDINPSTPLDPTKFSFFKGINDAGNGKGLLTAVVAGGLPAGTYRVCTLCAAMNHQPVIMPVAQRGAQDDCTKFVVTGNGNTINVKANDGSAGIAAAALAAQAIDVFNKGGEAALLAAGSTTAAAAATTTKKGGGGNAKAKATSSASEKKNGGGGGGAKTSSGKKGGNGGAKAIPTVAAPSDKKKGASGGAKAAPTATASSDKKKPASGGAKAVETPPACGTPANKGASRRHPRDRKPRFARREFVQ